MRHEEARRRLRLGADPGAEAHLAACPSCFLAIEKEDRLLLALRKAKPALASVPEGLEEAVISRWTARRRLPWLAGAAALAAACLASAVLLWLLAAMFSEPLSLAESALAALLAPPSALLEVSGDLLRTRFLDPVWFSSLLAVAAAGSLGMAVLYRQARPAGLRAGA